MRKPVTDILLSLLLAITTLCVGLYLGAVVYTKWLGLKTAPSLSLLYAYWQHFDRLPQGMVFPLKVSTAVAAAIPVVGLIMLLVSVLRGKRKELHGSSRFASEREIRKSGLLDNPSAKKRKKGKDVPDLILGKYKGKYLRWSNDGFLYLAARTRGGKGVGFVIPNCLHYRHSMVVNDVKKENFLITAGFRAKHGQKVFFFNPSGTMPYHTEEPDAPLISHRWNPLTYVRREPVYTYKDALGVSAIFYPLTAKGDSGNSNFWQQEARKLFTGLLLYLIETEKERDLSLPQNLTTMANLYRLTTPSNGKTLQDWIRDEFELRAANPEYRLSRNCETLLMGFANGNAKTSGDILSTMSAPLAIFLDSAVEAATSGDDFFFHNLRREPTTIYLGITPDEMKVYGTLMNLFFSQLCDVNVRQGLSSDNPKLKYQCLLLLDEFTALGNIPAIEKGVGYLAGYGIRPILVFQTPSQVEEVYGSTARQTFFSNFAIRMIFAPREQNDAEELSKLIGFYTYKAKGTSRSRGKSSSSGVSISDQKRAVMNPDELKVMPDSDCIISMSGMSAIYAEKIIYYKDPAFEDRAFLPIPHVPELNVHIEAKKPVEVSKPAYVSPEEMESFNWRDAVNAEELARSVLEAIIPAGSPPEYVATMVPYIARNWGEGSLSVIASILKETSGITVNTKEIHTESA